MKVAIVHDWLVSFGGAERVLAELLKLYPQADVFTLVNFMEAPDNDFLKAHHVESSFIQKLPFAKSKYRNYLPLMPLAIEQFDLSNYELVISSSHAVAKGVITGPDQTHVCLCYSPIRYAWDMQHQYLKEANLDRGIKGFFAKLILHYIRNWDYRTANGVDHFIAISQFISRRIWKVYRRESDVVYPPVDVDFFTIDADVPKQDFYITASRMVPYKKMDLIVEAFKSMPDKQLCVIGNGPDFDKIKSLAAKASNIEIIGYQSAEVLKYNLQKARAFVFAAEEDFGIAPLEAQACGTPVIAFGKGGALETMSENVSGVFFEEQNSENLCEAIARFESLDFKPQQCRDNALRFSTDNFRKTFQHSLAQYLQTS